MFKNRGQVIFCSLMLIRDYLLFTMCVVTKIAYVFRIKNHLRYQMLKLFFSSYFSLSFTFSSSAVLDFAYEMEFGFCVWTTRHKCMIGRIIILLESSNNHNHMIKDETNEKMHRNYFRVKKKKKKYGKIVRFYIQKSASFSAVVAGVDVIRTRGGVFML